MVVVQATSLQEFQHGSVSFLWLTLVAQMFHLLLRYAAIVRQMHQYFGANFQALHQI